MPNNATHASRKERERLQRRAEILDVALELLAESGYHDVTMREIAARTEFATGTLYNFFDSKEALYAEVVKTFGQKILSAIMTSLRTGSDEREAISNYIHAVITVLMEKAPAVQLYYRGAHGLPKQLIDPDGEITQLREAGLQGIAAIIASGMEKGVFRGLNPRQAAVCLSGIMESVIATNVSDPEGLSAEEMVTCVEGLFFHGILTAD